MVGVIANLAVYFAVHTLFGSTESLASGPVRLDVPRLASWHPAAFVLTAIALVLILRLKWSPLRTLGVCALLGLATLVVPGG